MTYGSLMRCATIYLEQLADRYDRFIPPSEEADEHEHGDLLVSVTVNRRWSLLGLL